MLVILVWLMFSLHVIFSDSAGNFESSNPCGKENPVANICQFSEIANTSIAFVYILNSPEQNKRTCTCSLSPKSPNVRIELRYRELTRSTENINLKINDIEFGTKQPDITTVISERKELVLNTNPVFRNSEEVCLLIKAEEDRTFNISCDYPTSDGTDSDTNIVGDLDSNTPCSQTTQVANICQFSEIANTSKVFVYILNSPGQNKRTCICSLSPTSPIVRIALRYREYTRSTENMNLKINDFTFDTNHTLTNTVLTERKELVLNTNPVFDKSEEVCLLITAEDGTGFNISCAKATNIPVTVTRGSEITEITLEPNHDNGFPSADNNCGEKNVITIIILSVICAMLLVIILCLLVYIRRLRRQIVIHHQSDKPTHTLQLSVIETLPDPDQVPSQEEKVASASFNTYERLNMYDNENCSAEMYQQLDVVNG